MRLDDMRQEETRGDEMRCEKRGEGLRVPGRVQVDDTDQQYYSTSGLDHKHERINIHTPGHGQQRRSYSCPCPIARCTKINDKNPGGGLIFKA